MLVSDLEKGRALLTEGLGMLDKSSEKKNGEVPYDISKYTGALKLARMKLLELK